MSASTKVSPQVIEIDADSTIEEAIDVLTTNSILSAPVYDGKNKKYIGFADLSDFLAVMRGVETMRNNQPKSKFANESISIHGINIDLSQSKSGDGLDIPVRDLLKQGAQNAPWFPLPEWEGSDLKTISLMLTKQVPPPWTPCRRVPLIGKDQRVTKIISQSELINKIYHAVVDPNSTAEPPVLVQTPRTNLHLGTRKILSVDGKSPVSEAFDKLIQNSVSAVAVTDASKGKRLVGVISTKDIGPFIRMRKAYLEGDKLSDDPLNLSCLSFITTARAIAGAQKMKRSEMVTVSLDTNIQEIIALMAKTKTHRVFIVDHDHRPVGIVSACDILKLLVADDLPWPASIIEKHMEEEQ